MAFTLTRLDTPMRRAMGGVSVLRMYGGCSQPRLSKNLRQSPDRLNQVLSIEGVDISTHNRQRHFLQGAA